MLGIAFIGGEAPKPEILKKLAREADLLAAADSGLIAAEEAGVRPHWIVGDMDSLGSFASRGSEASQGGMSRLDKYPPECIRVFPHDKDFTDTELAIDLLKEKGCNEIWLAGGGGGRLDHLFAIRSLFEREEVPERWYTANEEIRFVKEGTLLRQALPPGSLVSVFPLGNGPWEAESESLKWPLNGLSWERGGFGISNTAVGELFLIHSVAGRFMVITHLS